MLSLRKTKLISLLEKTLKGVCLSTCLTFMLLMVQAQRLSSSPSQWEIESAGIGYISDIDIIDNEVWVVGDGVRKRMDGGWTSDIDLIEILRSRSISRIAAVETTGGGGVWIVANNVALRYDRERWEILDIGAVDASDMTVMADGSVYIVGRSNESGAGIILKITESMVSTVWASLTDVPLASARTQNDSLWVVGEGGLVVRYSDGEWAEFFAEKAPRLHDVAVDHNGVAWVVGEGREGLGYLARWGSGSWVDSGIESRFPLHGIGFSANGYGWAVGDAGLVLRYTGNSWETFYQSSRMALHDSFLAISIDGAGAWVGSSNGLLYFMDGSGAHLVDSEKRLTGIAREKDVVVVVGAGNEVLVGESGVWRVGARAESVIALWDVAALGGNRFAIVGTDGVVGIYSNPGWEEIGRVSRYDCTALDVRENKLFTTCVSQEGGGFASQLIELDLDTGGFEVLIEKRGSWEAKFVDVSVIEDEIWVAHARGFWHSESGEWGNVDVPAGSGRQGSVFSVSMEAADSGVAGGQGVIYEYHDGVWSIAKTVPQQAQIHGVAVDKESGGAVAVGWYGQVWRKTGHGEWLAIGPVDPKGQFPMALFGVSVNSTDVYVCGSQGIVAYQSIDAGAMPTANPGRLVFPIVYGVKGEG